MVVLLIIIAVVSAELIPPFYYQTQIQDKYKGWKSPEYLGWVCANKSVECEKYFETKLGLSCYLVYGRMNYPNGTIEAAHMWNIVIINDKPWEFESTCLQFQKMSDKYIVDCIQEGFYVNGVKYEKCQPLDNWESIKNEL